MLSAITAGRSTSWGRAGAESEVRATHLHRELEALKSERTRHRNRIHGILIQQGLRV